MTLPSDRLHANCLAHIAQDNNHAVIIAVLRESEVARQSSFSLMEEDDYALLAREVAKDFPYLTVENLEDAMMRGVKGKLDTYKSRPLNFTRVYQWVEQRAPYSLGYWRHEFPELMRWAELCKVLDSLLPKLCELHAAHGAALPRTSITFAVTEHVRAERYPLMARNVRFFEDPAEQLAYDSQVTCYEYIKGNLFPKFAAEYPAFATKNPRLF